MEGEVESIQIPKLSKGTVPGEMVEEGRIWEWMREGDDAHPESFVWGYKNGCSLMRRRLLFHQTLLIRALYVLFHTATLYDQLEYHYDGSSLCVILDSAIVVGDVHHRLG